MLHFELLTRVTNSKSKNKKLHFELLTRSRKKNYLQVTFFVLLRVTNTKLKNKITFRVTNSKLEHFQFHFVLLTQWLKFYCFEYYDLP